MIRVVQLLKKRGVVSMYTNQEILEITKKQLALDFSCNLSDLDKEKNTVVENILKDGRRIYDNDGCALKILCFGNRAVVSTMPELMPWFQERFKNFDANWLFLYQVLKGIDKKLMEVGHEVADVHHYYIPKAVKTEVEPITSIRWYTQEEILQFEDDERFDEAFAFDKTHPDMLGVAALDGDKIIGMAGASSDGEILWQIGINVVEEARGRGIGTNLVILLKNELLRRGKIPFYSTIESNIYSQNIAIKAGFYPVWAELYSRKLKK